MSEQDHLGDVAVLAALSRGNGAAHGALEADTGPSYERVMSDESLWRNQGRAA